MDYTMSHQHTPAHLINSAQFQRWLHRLHRQKALLRVLFFVITFAYWELMLHLILFKDWHGLLYPLLMAVFMGGCCRAHHNRMPPKNEYDSVMDYP